MTVEALPGDPAGLGWRTRIGFAVGPDGTAGLRKHRSRQVIAVADCPIAHPLVGAADVTGRRWPGARGVEVTVSPGSGERSVAVSGPARGGGGNPRPWLTQHAAGRTWRVSAGVFWQVHPAAAGVLTEVVLAAMDPGPGDVALDLYCGAGLFTGALAAAVGPGGRVTAVESDVAAVRDARKNLAGFPQVRVHRGDAARMLARARARRRQAGRPRSAEDGAGGSSWSCSPRRGNCGGSATCRAIRPRWPGIWPCSAAGAGGSMTCARSTPSR